MTLESLLVLFTSSWVLRMIDIVNHQCFLESSTSSCFLYFLSIVQKHLQLLMWHSVSLWGRLELVDFLPLLGGQPANFVGVCVGMSLVSGLCLGWLIHFQSRLESLRPWGQQGAKAPPHHHSNFEWAGVAAPSQRAYSQVHSVHMKTQDTIWRKPCSLVFCYFSLLQSVLFSPQCFLSLGWLSDVFSNM